MNRPNLGQHNQGGPNLHCLPLRCPQIQRAVLSERQQQRGRQCHGSGRVRCFLTHDSHWSAAGRYSSPSFCLPSFWNLLLNKMGNPNDGLLRAISLFLLGPISWSQSPLVIRFLSQVAIVVPPCSSWPPSRGGTALSLPPLCSTPPWQSSPPRPSSPDYTSRARAIADTHSL